MPAELKIYTVYQNPNGATLYTMPQPGANNKLQQNLELLQAKGVNQLVCLLEESEISKLGLELEEQICEGLGIKYKHYPIPDYSVPIDIEGFHKSACKAANALRRAQKIVIHCHAGIGRSSILATAILINFGYSVEDALEHIQIGRGKKVPDTQAQVDWIIEYSNTYSKT